MRFLRTTLSCLAFAVALGVAVGVPAAVAGKVTPIATPLTPEQVSELAFRLTGSSCVLGATGTPITSYNYIIPPDDRFFVRLEAPQCVECQGTDTARLSTIHIVLNFITPCTLPIRYSVVMADTGCTQPIEETLVCGATDANLVGNQAGLIDFALPMPDSCKVTGQQFLAVNFKILPPECNVAGNRPLLILTSGGCQQCKSWNYFEDERNDLCGPPDPLPGLPMIFAEAWSCFVPNLPRTWGQLKIRYR